MWPWEKWKSWSGWKGRMGWVFLECSVCCSLPICIIGLQATSRSKPSAVSFPAFFLPVLSAALYQESCWISHYFFFQEEKSLNSIFYTTNYQGSGPEELGGIGGYSWRKSKGWHASYGSTVWKKELVANLRIGYEHFMARNNYSKRCGVDLSHLPQYSDLFQLFTGYFSSFHSF